MTFGCARCHDHKFDPLTQRDYTALAGIFLSTDTRYGTPGGVQGRNLGALLELPADIGLAVVAKPMAVDERQRKVARNEELRGELRRILADRAPDNPNRNSSTGGMSAFDVVRIFTQSAQLDAELANFYADGQPKTLAMGVLEKGMSSILPEKWLKEYLSHDALSRKGSLAEGAHVLTFFSAYNTYVTGRSIAVDGGL